MNRLLNKIILFKFFVLVVLGSCGNQQDTQTIEIHFDVDVSLLTEIPLNDSILGYSIYPPLGWVHSELPLQQPEGFFKGSDLENPISYLFLNPIDSAFMLITELKDFDEEKLSVLRIDYAETLNPNNIWNTMQHNRFRFNSLSADQFIMFNDAMVGFRLIITPENMVDNHHVISLDYLIPRGSYEQTIKSVESSIGSLVLLTQN